MIPKGTKKIFQFIDWLHSNTDNFKQYNDSMESFQKIFEQYCKLNPDKNYKEKLKADELQRQIKQYSSIVRSNVSKKIEAKAKELSIWDFNPNTVISFSGEINELKTVFNKHDIPLIIEYQQKYIDYRTGTGTHYFLQMFFADLDRSLKTMFSYFSDSEMKGLEQFEEKTFSVDIKKEPEQQDTIFLRNNFDTIAPKTVKSHFQKMVDKKLLSDKDLSRYLFAAFEKQTPPKEKFSLDLGFSTKGDIRKIFYSYYKDIAGKPHGKQKQYVALLGDYFEGFNTDSLATNFNK